VLKGIVKSRLNVIISGGTGSGKTTLLNVLSRFIPEEERIVPSRMPPSFSSSRSTWCGWKPGRQYRGKGEVVQRDLVKNSLRMRPDRIIVGEVRAKRPSTCFRHEHRPRRVVTTIHANSARDSLMRLETMVAMANLEIPSEFLRRYMRRPSTW